MNRTVQKRFWLLIAAVTVCLSCAVQAAVPSAWLDSIPTQQYAMGIRARVKLDGTILKSTNGGPGSYIAAFYEGTLRGVAEFDDSDGFYFYNLTVRAASNMEKGYTFKFYNPKTDEVLDCAETLDFTALGYGAFNSKFELEPQIFTPKTSTVTEPIISITANDPTATEGSTTDTGQFTISRKKANGTTNYTTGETVVNLKITGTATNGVDYTEITTTSKIASGKYQNTKTVKTLADSLTEGDETVIITILPGDGYVVSSSNTATVTIKDVPPVTETVAIKTAVSPADSGTVTGAGTYTKGASVTLKATAKSGYTFVKWTKGTSTTSLSTSATYTFTASAAATYTANFKAAATTGPVITINANDASATEGSTTDTGQFTITRQKDGANYTTGETVVNLQITGTATNGVDYTEITTTSKIASGKYKNTKTVKTLADDLLEGDETVIITILPGDGYTVGSANTATVTIKDATVGYAIKTAVSPADSGTVTGAGTYANGASVTLKATAKSGYTFEKWTKGTSTTSVSTSATYTFTASAAATYTANFKAVSAGPVITITANDATASEPGGTEGTGQFTITRQKDGANYTTGSTTVNLQITGTATNGVDYTTITTTSTIASGKYQNTKTVTPLEDALREGDETVIITILPGDGYTVGSANTATVTIKDYYKEVSTKPHPADLDEDGYISGAEYMSYTGIAKLAAIWGNCISWDGTDVLDIWRYTWDEEERISRRAYTRYYSAGSLVTMNLVIKDPEHIASLFIGEQIPEGWTLEKANGGILADGVLRFAFDYPDVPDKLSYTIRAPMSNLDIQYVLQSYGGENCYFAFSNLDSPDADELIFFGSEVEINSYGRFHPIDTSKDGYVSGQEYLAYAGAAKTIALNHSKYTWDGNDVLSLAPVNATRASVAPQLTRSVSTADYVAGSDITVTLNIKGTAGMSALFIGEAIPSGWTVTNAAGGKFVNGILKFAFEAPAIPSTVSYTIKAPNVGLKAGYSISSCAADTGCYVNGVIALVVEDTILGDAACGVAFEEWPLFADYYAAAYDGSAVVFNWPAISGAEGYLLTVYNAAGEVVATKSVAGTSATFAELPAGACRWDVTVDGMASPEQPLASAGVTAAVAAGDAAVLYFSGADAVIGCDVLFYSAATDSWTSAESELQIKDGAARLELGQPAAGGYLCIRLQGAADYVELFLE